MSSVTRLCTSCVGSLAIALALLGAALPAPAQPAPQAAPAAPPSKPEDEARMPWARNDGWFVKTWLVAGPFAESLDIDPLAGQGGEATLQATANAELKRPDGTAVRWKESTSWSDAFGVDEALGLAAPDSSRRSRRSGRPCSTTSRAPRRSSSARTSPRPRPAVRK